MNKNLTREDIDFIINLSKEMKTQDNRSTAQPYGLTIMQEQEEARPDGCGEHLLYRWLEETYYEDDWDSFKEDCLEYYEEDSLIHKTVKELNSFNEVMSGFGLSDDMGLESFNYDLVDTVKPYQFQFFLTEKACFNHIDRNRHNLREPKSYGVCLTRNPEMEQLYSVIHKMADMIENPKKSMDSRNIGLALAMNKVVHDNCKDVPHDIGLKLLEIVEGGESAIL